jgi:hypothetical protein
MLGINGRCLSHISIWDQALIFPGGHTTVAPPHYSDGTANRGYSVASSSRGFDDILL